MEQEERTTTVANQFFSAGINNLNATIFPVLQVVEKFRSMLSSLHTD